MHIVCLEMKTEQWKQSLIYWLFINTIYYSIMIVLYCTSNRSHDSRCSICICLCSALHIIVCSFVLFYFGHCIVCHFFIYASDYIVSIFKLFWCIVYTMYLLWNSCQTHWFIFDRMYYCFSLLCYLMGSSIILTWHTTILSCAITFDIYLTII